MKALSEVPSGVRWKRRRIRLGLDRALDSDRLVRGSSNGEVKPESRTIEHLLVDGQSHVNSYAYTLRGYLGPGNVINYEFPSNAYE